MLCKSLAAQFLFIKHFLFVSVYFLFLILALILLIFHLIIFLAAAQCTSAVSSFEKVDFLKLQNGRYIFGSVNIIRS